jgi:hypothetical protein
LAKDAKGLRKELRGAGLSDSAIEAAWPAWWSDEADASPTARAELRFTLAKNLGLTATSLIGDRVDFVWNDQARFKHLNAEDEASRAALTSFALAVGRTTINAAPPGKVLEEGDALAIRSLLLRQGQFVDLRGLLALCWGVGIPVMHLRVFPLNAKAMHATVVESGGRHAILLARDAQYPAPIAFTLAHELGHVCLGHLGTSQALIDMDDPGSAERGDKEEEEADRFALTLLAGSPEPIILANIDNPSARALAAAVMEAGPPRGIEPGNLALCLGYQTGNWKAANAALPHIYKGRAPVWELVNRMALRELDFDAIGPEAGDYLQRVMGMGDA